MARKCDRCGRNRSSSTNWKDGTEQLCSGCVQLQLLKSNFAIFPKEGSEMMIEQSREIERLIDKRLEEETLPLVMRGLSSLNGFIIRERDYSMVSHGIHYYNEKMKETNSFDNSQFVVARTNVTTNVTFVMVVYLKKGKEAESWKFFIGHMAGLENLE
jgi:hypothetical protein